MNRQRLTLQVGTISTAVALIVLIAGPVQSVRAQNPSPEKVIYNFEPSTGFGPGGLAGDRAGNLYAATANGGSRTNPKCPGGCGTILMLSSPSGLATTLYSFKRSPGSAGGPGPNGLVRDESGDLYVTTAYGGKGFGSVFKLTASGSGSYFYSFRGGNDGWEPAGPVTMDSSGNLYGTTFLGGGTGCGGQGCGIVYKLTPFGKEKILYRFTGGTDGGKPLASPILDAAANLYGTAALGGDLGCARGQGLGCGTVWKLDPSGNLTVLYAFTGVTDGAFPEAALVMDRSHDLYGVTVEGGNLSCASLGCGVVFEVDSSDNFTVLHAFAGGASDGWGPSGPLFRDLNGNLYGATGAGGDQSCTNGCGVVFTLDPSNNETILHMFTGEPSDGWGPVGGLISDGTGNLYGTTVFGGVKNSGVIFKVQTQ